MLGDLRGEKLHPVLKEKLLLSNKKVMTVAATWMNPKNVMLNNRNRSQTQKCMLYDSTQVKSLNRQVRLLRQKDISAASSQGQGSPKELGMFFLYWDGSQNLLNFTLKVVPFIEVNCT